MFVATYGVITEFGTFGEQLVRSLMAAVYPDGHFARIDHIDDLRESVFGKKMSAITFFSINPEKNVYFISKRLNAKSVVFYEDPNDVVNYCLQINRFTLGDSLKAAGKNLSALAYAIADESSLIVRYNEGRPMVSLIEDIVRYLGVTISDSTLSTLAASLGLTEHELLTESVGFCVGKVVPAPTILNRETHKIDEQTIATARSNILGVDALRAKHAEREIIWDTSMFFGQDRKLNFWVVPNEWIEMVGPARYLYFGPYLHLPGGTWQMNAEMRVRGNMAGNRADVDVLQDGDCIAVSTIDIPATGVFQVSSEIENDYPGKPLEFRIFMKEGAIDGEIILDRVRWRHIS
jgi:hypothetical protein